MTSVGLNVAGAELALGRDDAKKVVVVITDGVPMSDHYTGQAAEELKKKVNHLFWVPVTPYAPVDLIKEWATGPGCPAPVQHDCVEYKDVLVLNTWAELESPETVSRVVAASCEKVV